MVIKKRTDQGGSVASFILVGVISAVLLFGVIYYLRERGEGIRREQAISQDKKDQAAESAEEVKVEAENTASKNEINKTTSVVESTNLPNTGPKSLIVEISMIFIFVTSVTAYFGSRRELSRYL